MNEIELGNTTEEKDLGVIVADNLSVDLTAGPDVCLLVTDASVGLLWRHPNWQPSGVKWRCSTVRV